MLIKIDERLFIQTPHIEAIEIFKPKPGEAARIAVKFNMASGKEFFGYFDTEAELAPIAEQVRLACNGL